MDKTCKLWDVRTGGCIATLRGHEDEVLDIAFDWTGHKVASASADGNFLAWWLISNTQPLISFILGSGRLYDVRTHTCYATLDGHESEISKVCFNPQGSRILTASADKTARLWDSHTGKN